MKEDRRCWLTAVLLGAAICAGCRPPSPVRVSDGTIVLVRNGQTNAAIVITRQRSMPELVDYIWFLRSDGESTFDPKSPAVASGVVTNVTRIAVGPFSIEWSSAGNVGGYVYYPSQYRYPSYKMPWGKKRWTPPVLVGPAMAVTTETNLAKINVKDRRWRFRR